MAGVTRGAQVHHFPSKEDLVVAAIEHLAQQRVQSAVREVGRVQASPDPVSMVLEYLWESHQGPILLRRWNFGWPPAPIPCWPARSFASNRSSTARSLPPSGQLMPDHPAPKELRDIAYTAMDALRGILVASFVEPRYRAGQAAVGQGVLRRLRGTILGHPASQGRRA